MRIKLKGVNSVKKTLADAHFIRSLVTKANENMALMDGTTIPIKRLFEANEIVFGLWQDHTVPHGVDLLVLKGGKLLRECVASGENIRVRTTAIPCQCYEQALAAREVFGTRDLDA